MFNKVLLTTWSFNYPCLLTTWHCVLTTILTQILSRTSNMLPSVQKGVVTRAEYSIRILPMAVCFASSLVTGNMAYQYISLAYIQMIKAFTPVPLLLLSFVAGLERPSFVLFFIVLVVSAGVTLSSVGELAFSEIGFLLQLTAVLMDCFRVILMSLLLKDLQLDSLSLLYYTSPPSAVLTFGAFLALEADRLSRDIFTPTLCGALLLNGLLAFSLNVAVVYLVGSTNSMAMSLSAPLKDILIVLISVLLLRAPITSLQVPHCTLLYMLLSYLRFYTCVDSHSSAVLYCSAAGGGLRGVAGGLAPVPGAQERSEEAGRYAGALCH